MTKTTISFVTGGGADDIRIIPDEDRNTDSLGNKKSSFLYGDTAYFRIYSQNPEAVTVASTDGTLTPHGTFSEDIEDETVSFITEKTAETEKPVISLTSYTWLGKSLGSVEREGLFSVCCTETPAPDSGKLASASVSYRSVYSLWGLTLAKKSRDSYPVTVYAGVSNG